jgi:hypothetical protein
VGFLVGCSDKKEAEKIHYFYQGQSANWSGEIEVTGSVSVTKDQEEINHYKTPYDMLLRLKYTGDPSEIKSSQLVNYSYELGSISGSEMTDFDQVIISEYHGDPGLMSFKPDESPTIAITIGDKVEVIQLKNKS